MKTHELPKNAEEILQSIVNQDITQPDWPMFMVSMNPAIPAYWQGYFTAHMEYLSDDFDLGDGDFRRELVEIIGRCWDLRY